MESITLTASAADRVRHFLETQPGMVGLRVGIKKNGCTGWGYEVGLTDKINREDQVFSQDGLKIVIDGDMLPMLVGAEIDFVVDGLNRAFKFTNPNATAECGCGESFSVEPQ